MVLAEIQNVNEQIIVDDPHLWNGVKDPYLYNVKVFLYDENNDIKDVVYKKIGFSFIMLMKRRIFLKW